MRLCSLAGSLPEDPRDDSSGNHRREFLPVVFERDQEVGVRELVNVRSTYTAALAEAEELADRCRRCEPTARAGVLKRDVSDWVEVDPETEVDDGS